LGVGIGLAGIIDSAAGICRYSPSFGWRDVDLVTPLESKLGLDVRLANDVDSLTIAEQWFGHGRGYEHFVVVTVGRGIGAGFVINGRFYGGHEGGVGELGHVMVQPDGPSCVCGRRGCLEVLASDVALLEAARVAVARGHTTTLANAADITIDALVVAADEGDVVARRLLAESGRWLGIGMSILVNLLNPQLIILAGEGVEAGVWRLEPMRQALQRAQFDSLGSSTKLVVESAGDITWARGAACVVLSEFFKSPLHRDRPVNRAAGFTSA
jgi:predicted NBD/HSP70 family sugar kinase